MSKPEYEFHVPEGEWRPAGGEVDGIWEQILSFNPDNGDYTRLLRFEPGVDSSPNGTFTHTFWEEVFIVEGDLTDRADAARPAVQKGYHVPNFTQDIPMP